MEELSRDAPSIRTVDNGTDEPIGSKFIENPADQPTIKDVSRDLLRNTLDEILSALTEQQSMVLKLRFGLVDGRSHSVKEIGKGFNLPKSRIKQIEHNALHRLLGTPCIRGVLSRLPDYPALVHTNCCT